MPPEPVKDLPLRRDYIVNQAHSASLITPLPPGGLPPRSITGESLFRSTSPQRPERQSVPKVYTVMGVPIDYGGRNLGPTDYDTLEELTMNGGVPPGGAAQSAFRSTSPRLPARSRAIQLTDNIEFLPNDRDLVSNSSAAVPGARGRTWNKGQRYPSPPFRDHGLDEVSDPIAGSLTHDMEKCAREYRASFRSGTDRFTHSRSMTGAELGPGRYRSALGMSGGVPRADAPSPMFRAPTSSKAVRRPEYLKNLLKAEPYGGQWMVGRSVGANPVPQRGGTLERHWTSRQTIAYR